MSVCFARFHPNLVVGGTYSGQIVLWDNRSHRRTPVQRTPLSAAAHTVKDLVGLLYIIQGGSLQYRFVMLFKKVKEVEYKN